MSRFFPPPPDTCIGSLLILEVLDPFVFVCEGSKSLCMLYVSCPTAGSSAFPLGCWAQIMCMHVDAIVSAEGSKRPKGISLSVSDPGSGHSIRTPVRRGTDSGQSTPIAGTPQSATAPGRSANSARRQKRFHSSPYDINSIVVQFSGTSRVEKIQYKQIATPRFRILDVFTADEPMDTDSVSYTLTTCVPMMVY